MYYHLSALTVINALTGRKKNTFTTHTLLLSFWTWTAHSTLLFLMDSTIPGLNLFFLLFADFVLPWPAGYPQLHLTYLSGLFFCFPSLLVPLPQFPCLLLPLLLYIFTSVCCAPLQSSLPSPWVSPLTACAFSLFPEEGGTVGMGCPLINLSITQVPVRVSASAPGKSGKVTGTGGDFYDQLVRGKLASAIMW